jgi:hypothetical protein
VRGQGGRVAGVPAASEAVRLWSVLRDPSLGLRTLRGIKGFLPCAYLFVHYLCMSCVRVAARALRVVPHRLGLCQGAVGGAGEAAREVFDVQARCELCCVAHIRSEETFSAAAFCAIMVGPEAA